MMQIGSEDPRRVASVDIHVRMESEFGFRLVVAEDGALLPDRLVDRGDRGWSVEDRDSEDAFRLASLYRRIDARVIDYRGARGSKRAQRQIAEDIMATWVQIRQITGGEW